MNDEHRIAFLAVRLYAERHPRPSQVNQKQAAEMLCVSPRTVHNLPKACVLEQIDEALRPR